MAAEHSRPVGIPRVAKCGIDWRDFDQLHAYYLDMGETGLFCMGTSTWIGRISAFIKSQSPDLRLVIFQRTKTRRKSRGKIFAYTRRMFAHTAHTIFAFKHALKSLFLHTPNP